MKRVLTIAGVFSILFGALCFASCDFDSNVNATIQEQHPDCNSGLGVTEQVEGCYCNNSCVDCYWFPTVCGCYSNDISASSGFSMCDPISCVVFGFDCTFLECYRAGIVDMGTDIERRKVVTAVEGVDYTIDSFKVVANSQIQEFENGKFTFDDLKLIIELINFTEAVDIEFYIEYTANKELHSTEFYLDIEYKNNIDDLLSSNFPSYISLRDGNGLNERYKSKNLQQGKHFVYTKLSLTAYEAINFETFENISFTVNTYDEVEE